MHRFRVTFAKGLEVRYVSHLDLMRTWERILRRAAVRLAHSQGFNPRPRLVFAAPLPLGTTSEAEIVDVDVEDDLSAAGFGQRLRPALPPGIQVSSIVEVGLSQPAVMAQILSSDYLVTVQAPGPAAEAEARIAAFADSQTVPYERLRKGKSKPADMRPVVLDLRLDSLQAGMAILFMRLRMDREGMSVRPEEVVRALHPEWMVLKVHRTALALRPEAPGPAAPVAEEDRARERVPIGASHVA